MQNHKLVESGVAPKRTGIEITQFELTKALYTSELFDKVDLTCSAKLFLWALCTHFNPKKESMFPAQATVAKKLGISEKSAQRAVKELKDCKLIEYETKGVNHYRFSRTFFELVKMSCGVGQNVLKGGGQNVLQTNKNEKRNNSGFSKKLNYGGSPYPQYGQNTGRMVPDAEETKKMIEEHQKIRDMNFNPYEYNREDAYNWVSSIPKFWLLKSDLAKTLIEKYEFEDFLYVLTTNYENSEES